MVRELRTTGFSGMDRVTISGHADTRPLASNDNAKGRAKNRRIEIVINQEAVPVTKPKPASAVKPKPKTLAPSVPTGSGDHPLIMPHRPQQDAPLVLTPQSKPAAAPEIFVPMEGNHTVQDSLIGRPPSSPSAPQVIAPEPATP